MSQAEMTKYACPHCNGHIKAGAAYAGKRIPCPHCAVTIEIPRIAAIQQGNQQPAAKLPLRAHRLATPELLGTARAPIQCETLHYMLVVWLAAGAANIGWLVYLNWGAPFMAWMVACLSAAWGIVLTATLMVRRNRWVKPWAIVFAVISLATIPMVVPLILAANTSINQKVPALVAGLSALAMLVVALEAIFVKRKGPVARAKIIST